MGNQPMEMSFELREQIFSKEAISINDLALLMGVSYACAQRLMTDIKCWYKITDKKRRCLNISGRLLLRDYFEYFGIDPNQPRYFPDKRTEDEFYFERLDALHTKTEQQSTENDK